LLKQTQNGLQSRFTVKRPCLKQTQIVSALPENFSNCFAETDTKRLAKPFYSKTPLLKTDANRFGTAGQFFKPFF